MITLIGSHICKYMWEHSEIYADYFYTINLKSGVEIRSCGYFSDDDSGLIVSSDIVVDSVNYSGNVMMHSSPEQYEKSVRSVHAKSQNISIHVIAITEMENVPVIVQPTVGVAIFAHIPKKLFAKYFAISNSSGTTCGKHFDSLTPLSKIMVVEGVFVDRLHRKCKHIESWHAANGDNWMNTLLYAIFDSVQIATKNRRMFISLLSELKGYMLIQSIKSLESMEALLMGTAGLLDGVEYPDTYLYHLRKEYDIFSKMNGITKLNGHHWVIASASSTPIQIVMAQLAAILFYNKTLLYDLVERCRLSDIRKLFQTEVSEYWLTHYEFGVVDKKPPKSKRMTDAKIDILLINGVLPFVAQYSKVNNVQNIDMDSIMDFYTEIESENNMFTKQWEQNGVELSSAFESQAFIELSKNYCAHKLCYCCPIGKKVLK